MRDSTTKLRILIFSLAMHFLCFLTVGVLAAEVTIVSEVGPLSIKSHAYEARIESDGCLTNLRINGREFLAPRVAISRGSYFFHNGPLKLPAIERLSENIVVAKSDSASIRYEFGESEMTWQLTNNTEDLFVFFFVFAKDLEAAYGPNGKVFALPINEDWTEVGLISGNSKLRIRGCDKLWGPWEGPHQVCQVSLAPREKKSVKLSVGTVLPAEREQIKSLLPKPARAKLEVFSPKNYQVYQRSSVKDGTFGLSGQTTTDASEIRVRVTGKSVSGELNGRWQSIPIEQSTRSFSAILPLAAGGWYTLEVEALKQDKVLADLKVEHFGMGEVFVGAGQSNSTNCGEIRTQQKSGMVSSFGGDSWKLADDPQLGVADKSQGGSFWPAFGDAMYERFGVPIGVATTGFGGTSVNQWQPDGDLFPWMMTRIHQLGPFGFRAILWHQGESDVEMPSDEYFTKLNNVIQASRQQSGWYLPWFVAQASYHNPDRAKFETVRAAQQQLWNSGIALQGPDTDTLTGDRRDLEGAGIHFSPKGLYEHGHMWADLVGNYLEKLLNSNR